MLVRELISLEAKAREVRARTGRRTTRAALAKKSGVSEQTLSDWFNGRHHPRDLDQLMKVVRVLAGWAEHPAVPYQPWARLLETASPPRTAALAHAREDAAQGHGPTGGHGGPTGGRSAVDTRAPARQKDGSGPVLTVRDADPPEDVLGRTAARPTRRTFLANAVTATAAAGFGVAGWQLFGAPDLPPKGKRWAFPADRPVSSNPAVARGVVYFGSDDQHVYAVDARTGKPVWPQPFPTGGSSRSSPAVARGVVYAGSDDGKLYALDVTDGRRRWERPTGAPLGWSSPVLVGDSVYVGIGDEKNGRSLQRIDAASGGLRWRRPLDTSAPIWGPAVARGVVYAGCDDGHLYMVDAADGRPLRPFRAEGAVWRPTVADGTVYVGSDDGNLYAVNPGQPRARWAHSIGAPVGSTPLVVGSTVYVGSDDGNVYALAVTDGQERWRADTDGQVRTQPAAAEGTVYISGVDGYLYALRARDGKRQWRERLGNALWSSPTAADGSVYVGSDDNHLYAVTV
ncbi:PQQ-binding-like beta-propeller repeat protein [Streptomyces sp. NPDC059788]|uniref:outer membrane protein assembly factor BamB family protein n=1 Tax=Streptomyces sp. NPDC059788 TaxID=3346948 RepID=UPI0036668A60